MGKRTCRCCVPGCPNSITIMPFATIYGSVDLIDGLCRDCLARVHPAARRALRTARLQLRLHDGADELIQLYRAWEAVRLQASERAGRWAA